MGTASVFICPFLTSCIGSVTFSFSLPSLPLFGWVGCPSVLRDVEVKLSLDFENLVDVDVDVDVDGGA